MAKSMLHAVVGLLVKDGRLDLDAPADVPEWSAPGDPRHAITLRHLLAMRDGLDFVEDYVDDRTSDVIAMLFGDGQADMAHFAADRPLAAAAGHPLQLLLGDHQHHLGRRGPPARARRALRGVPARNASSAPSAWPAPVPSSTAPAPGWPPPTSGPPPATSPASACSTCATACGTAPGCCPRDGWTTAAPWSRIDPEDGPYGAHWWGVAGDTLGTFRASGYEGQSITICPALDLIVVRLGKTPTEHDPDLVAWRADVVQAFS